MRLAPILTVLILALILAVSAIAAPKGDPIDGNDTPTLDGAYGDAANVYCVDYGGDGMSPAEAWLCQMAIEQDNFNWWNMPW